MPSNLSVVIVLVVTSLYFSDLPGKSNDNRSPCVETWEVLLARFAEDGRRLEQFKNLAYKCGREFKLKLRNILNESRWIGYGEARRAIFVDLDNVKGTVCGVYTGKCIQTHSIPNSSVMNCEHTWPQSKGAVGIAKSDLHHLFPSDSRTNSIRGNLPFCEVETAYLMNAVSQVGFSRLGTKCFEPRDVHKGNVARAMLYFSIRYGKPIDNEQEQFFRRWLAIDPVDKSEQDRAAQIAEIQGLPNPFVKFPELIDLVEDY